MRKPIVARFTLNGWTRQLHVVAPFLLATQAAAQVPADTVRLTLAEIRERALAANPSFLATRKDADIAGGRLRQASIYPYNPEFGFVAPGKAVTETSPYEMTLTWDVAWGGQLGLRRSAAREGVVRATQTVRDAGSRLLADVGSGFYRLLAADRRRQIAFEVFALNDTLLRAVRIQLQEGEISSLEANLAEIEVGRARARVLAATRETATAGLLLKRMVGLDPAVVIQPVDTTPAVPALGRLAMDSLVSLALVRRADVAAADAGVREASGLTRLSSREGLPNLRIGALGEWDRSWGDARVGVTAAVGLPLFNRNQGTVAQRQAEAAQAELAAAAVRLQARSEVTDALSAYLVADEEVTALESSVLEPARRSMPLLDVAYRAGKIPLSTLILLRNQLLEAELSYWDSWLARSLAVVALEAATGALLPDATAPASNGRTSP